MDPKQQQHPALSNEYVQHVTQSFIKQFYEVLSKSTHDLYKFYMDESSFAHSDAGQLSGSVSGIENIKQRIAQLQLTGAQVDISNGSVDFQRTINNGILVVVTGNIRFKSGESRQFLQTFVLASQVSPRTGTASYYVLNSVMRTMSTPSPVAKTSDSTSQYEAQALSSLMEAEKAEKAKEEAARRAAEAEAAEAAAKKQKEEEERAAAEALAKQKAAERAAAKALQEEQRAAAAAKAAAEAEAAAKAAAEAKAAQEAYDKAHPKTWAQKMAASNPAPPPAPVVPAGTIRRVAVPKQLTGAADAEATPASSTRPAAAASASSSLYVSRLPEDAVADELAKIFSKFGTLQSVDTVTGKRFAFVKYQNPSGVRAALDAGTLTYRNQVIHIEERSSVPARSVPNPHGGGKERGPRPGGDNRNRDKAGRGGNGTHSGRGAGDRAARPPAPVARPPPAQSK